MIAEFTLTSVSRFRKSNGKEKARVSSIPKTRKKTSQIVAETVADRMISTDIVTNLKDQALDTRESAQDHLFVHIDQTIEDERDREVEKTLVRRSGPGQGQLIETEIADIVITREKRNLLEMIEDMSGLIILLTEINVVRDLVNDLLFKLA
jgi:hypothetical protein